MDESPPLVDDTSSDDEPPPMVDSDSSSDGVQYFNIQDDDAVKKISDRNIQDRRMHALDDYKRNSVDHGKDHEDGDKSGSGNATADSKGSGLFVGDEEKEMFPDEMEADAK